MNRTTLCKNISRLNETEFDIFTYLIKVDISWFNDISNSDSDVENVLNSAFQPYFCVDSDNKPHPIKKIYDKIINGVYFEPLFPSGKLTWEYSVSFCELAERVNGLYTDVELRMKVLYLLKAMVVRDFEYISESENYPNGVTLDMFLQNLENDYMEFFIDFIEEDDLKMILSFFGEK